MHMPFWSYKKLGFPQNRTKDQKRQDLHPTEETPGHTRVAWIGTKVVPWGVSEENLFRWFTVIRGPGTGEPAGHSDTAAPRAPPRGPPEHVLNRPNARTLIERPKIVLKVAWWGFWNHCRNMTKTAA